MSDMKQKNNTEATGIKIIKIDSNGTAVKAFTTKVRKGVNAGKYYVHGYLIDSKKSLRIDGMKERSMVYRGTRAEAEVKYLVGRLRQDYKTTISDQNMPIDRPFEYAYNSVSDKKILQGNAKWNTDATFYPTLKYFQNNVIPMLDKYGYTITSENAAEIYDALVAKALGSKRSKGNNNTAKISVSGYLFRINIVLNNLRLLTRDINLPQVTFPVSLKSKRILSEQIKSLNSVARITLAYILDFLPPEQSITLGVALMYYAGLRTSEAAAPCIRDLTLLENFASYRVATQLKSNGEKTSVLKTRNAYRTIVLPYAFCVILRRRMDYLKNANYTDAEIADMPVVAAKNDCRQYAGTSKLSAFAAMLLNSIKAYDEKGVCLTMLKEPMFESDGVTRITDPSAYILRRDWCSRMSNICGLEYDTLDYLLGHENDHNRTSALSMNAEKCRKLASKMERFVALPEVSKHPLFSPYSIRDEIKNQPVPSYNCISPKCGLSARRIREN